jgi:hypothetical protein
MEELKVEIGSIIKNGRNNFTWVMIDLNSEYATFLCTNSGRTMRDSFYREGTVHRPKNKNKTTNYYIIQNTNFSVVGKINNIPGLLALYGVNLR